MHRESVDRRKWIGEQQFLRAQFLFAAARPGSSTACDLQRLAAARLERRRCGRRALIALLRFKLDALWLILTGALLGLAKTAVGF